MNSTAAVEHVCASGKRGIFSFISITHRHDELADKKSVKRLRRGTKPFEELFAVRASA